MIKRIFNLFKTKKEVAADIKLIVLAEITKYRTKQSICKVGNSDWMKYQDKITALSDIYEIINYEYNLVK